MSKLWFMVGLPASGKSTWAETHKDELNAIVHSSDSIRAELGNVNDQSKNELVFNILHKRVKEDLLNGKNVIYDSTGLSRKNRLHFLKQIQNIPCEKICVLFATPIEVCKANNENRNRKVPESVIDRMVKNFQVPSYAEGWNDIQIVYWDYKKDGISFEFFDDLQKWSKISHDNPHHENSIGDHMWKAYKYYADNMYDVKEFLLSWAILLHDCGKVITKAFINSKGEPCDTAHFYNHNNVGSYESLFYLKDMFVVKEKMFTDEEILYISLLIEMHMRPFLAWDQSDKAKEKDRKLFGDDIISAIEIIHECDLAAH